MSPTDRQQALDALRQAHTAYEVGAVRRREAIVAASQAGAALREISDAIGNDLSHEVIRGIVGPRAGVAFEWDGELFQLSEPQTRALIYKSEGFARGAFPGDVARLGAGEEWLTAAGDLARAMQRIHVGLRAKPIRLTRKQAFALYQILRMSYMTGRTRIADLRDQLQASFGTLSPSRSGRK